MNATAFLARAALLVLLAGCTSLPKMEVPGEARIAPSQQPAAASSLWQYDFGDPAFAAILNRLHAANQDAKLAGMRIAAARSELRAAEAERRPNLTAGGSIGGVTGSLRGAGTGFRSDSQGEARMTIEPDIWGERRAAITAAERAVEAAQSDAETLAMEISALTARAFVAAQFAAERIENLDRRIKREAEAIALLDQRVVAGLARRDELIERQVRMESLQGERADAIAECRRSGATLRALLGIPRQDAAAVPLRPLASLGEYPAPVEVPLELVARRPDNQARFARLQAADAGRAAAIARARPRVTFSIAGGVLNATVRALLSDPTGFASMLIQIDGPLYDGGRRKAAIERAQIDRSAAEIEWERGIVYGLREIVIARTAFDAAGEKLDRRRASLALAKETAALIRTRYAAGQVSRLELIDAESRMDLAADEVEAALRDRLDASINLYNALGGEPDRSKSSTTGLPMIAKVTRR